MNPPSPATPLRSLVLGTRGSGLALAQANLAAAALADALPGVEITLKTITTSGDQKLDLSLIKQTPAGAKGLFTKELEVALLSGEIDIAVHSCKDMPGEMLQGLTLTSVLKRAPTEDVLISKSAPNLAALAPGSRIGTSSVRRARQLLWKRPDLGVEEIRGNVQTRLRKLLASETLEGILLARAGLERLGFRVDVGQVEFEGAVFQTEILDLLPAIGQGAIALQTRIEGPGHEAAVAVNHLPTWLEIRAERELMRLLQGDCNLPVGVATTRSGESLRMEVILFGPEQEPPRQTAVEGPANEPEALAAAAYNAL